MPELFSAQEIQAREANFRAILGQRGDIVAFHDHGPPPADFGALFLAGLARHPRSLAGQMLLNRRSPAFRKICALPEYYIQRAELEQESRRYADSLGYGVDWEAVEIRADANRASISFRSYA